MVTLFHIVFLPSFCLVSISGSGLGLWKGPGMGTLARFRYYRYYFNSKKFLSLFKFGDSSQITKRKRKNNDAFFGRRLKMRFLG